jgi:hypothetical protein
MKNRLSILLAVASLALAALACQAVTGSPNTAAAPTDVVIENTVIPAATEISPTEVSAPTQTEAPVANSDVLLEDDFTSGGRTTWGTGTDKDSSVEYLNDGLNMQLFTKSYIVWTSPNDQEYENIHMEVTALNNGSDSATAFGFMCNQQYPITDSRYYLAITPGGEYAIGKAALALDDVILTKNGEWGKSNLIAKNAASYRIGADCGNGKLTLYVDGQPVDSASDSSYTNGRITLFVWSTDNLSKANVTFDDFLMTKLP